MTGNRYRVGCLALKKIRNVRLDRKGIHHSFFLYKQLYSMVTKQINVWGDGKSPPVLPSWAHYAWPEYEALFSLMLHSSSERIMLIVRMYCLSTLVSVHCPTKWGEMTPRFFDILCVQYVPSAFEGNLWTATWALKQVFAKTTFPSSILTSLPKGICVWRMNPIHQDISKNPSRKK